MLRKESGQAAEGFDIAFGDVAASNDIGTLLLRMTREPTLLVVDVKLYLRGRVPIVHEGF